MDYSMLVNGEPRSDLDVLDRGLQFGDGFFTTIKITNGHAELWNYHWQRLKHCSAALSIPIPEEAQVINEIIALIGAQEQSQSAQPVRHSVVKVIFTRGSGGRGYTPPSDPVPTRIVSCHSFPEHYKTWQQQGIRLAVADTRLGIQPALAGLKTLNRLEQVLIKQELEHQSAAATDKAVVEPAAAHDLVVLDTEGYVVETSASNVFWRKGAQWFTPDLSRCGVKGVVRDRLLERNANVQEVRVQLDQLLQADEVFVCNSLMGLVSVTEIGEANRMATIRHWVQGSESLLPDR